MSSTAVKHGTKYRYDKGCRCDDCRTAKLARRRLQRARARAANSPSYQRELAATRARKDRYRLPCPRCGALMDGSNGVVGAPKVCARCAPDVHGPRYAAEQRGVGPTVGRVLDFIGDGERRFTEICEHVGITQGHASNILYRLVGYGLIVRVRHGVYRRVA